MVSSRRTELLLQQSRLANSDVILSIHGAVIGWGVPLTRRGGTYLRHVGFRVRDSFARDESRDDLA